MSNPLRFNVYLLARPPLLASLGLTAAVIAFAVPTLHTPTRPQMVSVFPAPVTVEPEPPVQTAVRDESAQPLHSSELALVFAAGGATYMKLADFGFDGLPKLGKVTLYSEDYVETAVASLGTANVPAEYRRWQDRKVTVDNACTTTVTGFAIVSRLTGDTGYAGVADETWNARSVLEHGSMVLAAKLAGCNGTFARDAALPPVIVPEQLADAKLARQARALLIASKPARETQREYAEFERTNNWWDDESAEFSTKIVRHPTTGVTWVSVHGHIDHACGDAMVNVWGLFRVQADGRLVAVQLRVLDDLFSIDELIDIDNDGELELVGQPWLGLDTVVTTGSGEELDRLSLAFFGCPC